MSPLDIATAAELLALASPQDPIWRPASVPTAHGQVAEEHGDRTLAPLLGYRPGFHGVIQNYMEDHESGNAAALLEWKP